MANRTTSFDMPEELHDAVERRAKELGIKKSLLFRESIIEGLSKATRRIKDRKGRLPT